MTDATKNSIAVSYGDRKTGTRYSRDGTAVLQRTDCLAGQEYLPMDIFVDTKDDAIALSRFVASRPVGLSSLSRRLSNGG